MMTTWVAIVAVGVLFAVFGVVGQRSCNGHCSGCGNACSHFREEEHDVS